MGRAFCDTEPFHSRSPRPARGGVPVLFGAAINHGGVL